MHLTRGKPTTGHKVGSCCHISVHRFRGANGDNARFWNDSQILVDKNNVRKSPHEDRIVETGGYYANECARVSAFAYPCVILISLRVTAIRDG